MYSGIKYGTGRIHVHAYVYIKKMDEWVFRNILGNTYLLEDSCH